MGSYILRLSTNSAASSYFTSASAEFQAYLDHHDRAVKFAHVNRDLVAYRIKYCFFEKGPNPRNAEKGEDTVTPTMAEAGES